MMQAQAELDGSAVLAPSAALTRFVAPIVALLGPVQARKEHAVRYGFRVSSLGLLIKPGTGSEVVEARGIAAMPNAPRWLAGVMNLRGNPVPVFDLCAALELARNDESQKSMVLVLDKGDKAAGLLIDGMPRVVPEGTAIDLPTALPARLAPFAPSALATADAVWLEFDHAGFLTNLAAT
jgi:chemotaxis signal transduction protein